MKQIISLILIALVGCQQTNTYVKPNVIVRIDTIQVETYYYQRRISRTRYAPTTVTDTVIKLDNGRIITRHSGLILKPFNEYKLNVFYKITKNNELIEY